MKTLKALILAAAIATASTAGAFAQNYSGPPNQTSQSGGGPYDGNMGNRSPS